VGLENIDSLLRSGGWTDESESTSVVVGGKGNFREGE
jgi:hypothetical protein